MGGRRGGGGGGAAQVAQGSAVAPPLAYFTPCRPASTPPSPLFFCPTAVLCFMVGPLGLLCHLITKAALGWWRRRGAGRDGEYVMYRF